MPGPVYRFDRILCPTDFSSSSIEAIRLAAFAVKRFNGTLTLLYVDEFEVTPMGFLETDPLKREHHRRYAEEFAQRKFSELTGTLQLDPQRTKGIVRFGSAYKEIISEAEKNAYAVIALSTNGLGCSSPHLIGSTAERIVRLSRTPVLTVRPHGTPLEWRTNTILCPTDFSEYGNYILPYAISIAHEFFRAYHHAACH